MELATIKSMVLQDDALAEVVSHPEYKSYDILARHGYKPARKVAPIANGYPLIDVSNVSEALSKLGVDIPKRMESTLVAWEREAQGRDIWRSFSRSDWVEGTYKKREWWYVASAIRGNPTNNRPTRVSILSTQLSSYNGLIPPANAAKIGDALESGLFDEVAIWTPSESEYPDEALKFDEKAWLKEKGKRMLEDPIAVGIVSTKQREHSDPTQTYYFIDFWPEDVKLEGNAKWLLTPN